MKGHILNQEPGLAVINSREIVFKDAGFPESDFYPGYQFFVVTVYLLL